MNYDPVYMHRCIELARLGAGYVAPNPMVGSVLVYSGEIIGEGYHHKFGQPHAEVNCIRDAEGRSVELQNRFDKDVAGLLAESILYVSLEPCAHFGKTPPCANLIIEKKIPSVVVGCRDPFKQVDGKGIEKLHAAGVQVSIGVLEEETKDLNKRFFTFHTLRRPYFILKWAQSSDRKIAGINGTRLQISNEFTNRLVHKWRSEEQAIMVGTNTVLIDDPALTTRLWTGLHPVRIVVDMDLRLPGFLQVHNGEVRTIVFNSIKQEESGNLLFYQVNKAGSLVGQISEALYKLNILSVLVEGGTKLLQSFIDAGCWDEARVITNNDIEIKQGIDAPELPPTVLTGMQSIDSDSIRIFKPYASPGW